MEMKELQICWTELPAKVQNVLFHLLRYPTTRNKLYVAGYINAMRDWGQLSNYLFETVQALAKLAEKPELCREFITFLESL